MEKKANSQFALQAWIKEIFPGLLLAVVIGLTGRYISQFIPNLGSVTMAIILGILVSNLFGVSKRFVPGTKFAEKKVLSLAIMLMGLKLELTVLGQLGLSAIMIIIIMVGGAIFFGFISGRLLGLSRGFSLLLGIGNGICGSSAIAATAPFLTKKEEEIGLAIGVVNLLGTIGIFLLPLITYLLKFGITESGLAIGGSLQAVGQVVAAGFSINDNVGNLATVIKMGRILMLGPVVLMLGFLQTEGLANTEQSTKKKFKIPGFIIGFFIFSLLGSFALLPAQVTVVLKDFSKIFLIIAMAAIGLKIRFSSLLNQGPKALLVGIIIFACQILLITGLIYIFY